MSQRALDSDTAALSATNEQLIGLLLLRQASLMNISDSHAHREHILAAKQSAEAELLYRLKTAEEHKQMAALACLKLDLLDQLAGSVNLKKHVQQAKAEKDQLITDPGERQKRYEATCVAFSFGKK